jgi:hypothetical protein
MTNALGLAVSMAVVGVQQLPTDRVKVCRSAVNQTYSMGFGMYAQSRPESVRGWH